jgi:hypothetical protein
MSFAGGASDANRQGQWCRRCGISKLETLVLQVAAGSAGSTAAVSVVSKFLRLTAGEPLRVHARMEKVSQGTHGAPLFP